MCHKDPRRVLLHPLMKQLSVVAVTESSAYHVIETLEDVDAHVEPDAVAHGFIWVNIATQALTAQWRLPLPKHQKCASVHATDPSPRRQVIVIIPIRMPVSGPVDEFPVPPDATDSLRVQGHFTLAGL